MSTETEVRQSRLRLYATSKASQVMEARKENPRTSRAIIRAMQFTNGVDFQNPRTLMIENCPLGVHVDLDGEKLICGQLKGAALN
jgi:hypothetical protein